MKVKAGGQLEDLWKVWICLTGPSGSPEICSVGPFATKKLAAELGEKILQIVNSRPGWKEIERCGGDNIVCRAKWGDEGNPLSLQLMAVRFPVLRSIETVEVEID